MSGELGLPLLPRKRPWWEGSGVSLEGFVPHKEGRTTLLVPELSLGKGPPELFPAFFNPRGKVVRDISVIAVEAFSRTTSSSAVFADPLAGVGGRSLRIAVECPSVSAVKANDLNPIAIQAASRAAHMNGCEGKVELSGVDANLFLARLSSPQGRPHIIDVDPFGTPAPFVESSLRAIVDGGMLAVTATDTAVLSGLHPEVARRKYGAQALRTDYSRESMLRMLLGLVAHRALVYDMVIDPLLCHADQHYARVYCRVRISPTEANASLDRIGYLLHCFKCGHRESVDHTKETCPLCGGRLKASGPLWVGDLYEKAFLDSMCEASASLEMKKYDSLFARAREEIGFPPFYFKIPYFTDQLGVASLSPSDLVERLTAAGFRAVRSSVDGQGVKTTANVEEVVAALSSSHPMKPRHTK
jgi:tRNA (guanine26-N2/guanine27-N2)-dimethyltransferase